MILRGSVDLGPMNVAFGALKARASDFRKPFKQVGEKAREEFGKRFEQSGPGWKPNAAGTQTLVKTGNLWDSFARLGAKGNISMVERDTAQFGSNLPYAADVQQGGEVTATSASGKAYKMTLPARPIVVDPSAPFRGQIGQIAADHFTVKPGERS